MIKRILVSFINGAFYAIGITLVIQIMVLCCTNSTPLLPEYAEHFDSQLEAFAFQLLLIGVMSGITSAGTAIFETKKIGLLTQSILFLIIMLSAWIPVACFAWGFHKYTLSMIITICSIVVSYSICWGIQYVLCRKEIDAINAKLMEKKEGK